MTNDNYSVIIFLKTILSNVTLFTSRQDSGAAVIVTNEGKSK